MHGLQYALARLGLVDLYPLPQAALTIFRKNLRNLSYPVKGHFVVPYSPHSAFDAHNSTLKNFSPVAIEMWMSAQQMENEKQAKMKQHLRVHQFTPWVSTFHRKAAK